MAFREFQSVKTMGRPVTFTVFFHCSTIFSAVAPLLLAISGQKGHPSQRPVYHPAIVIFENCKFHYIWWASYEQLIAISSQKPMNVLYNAVCSIVYQLLNFCSLLKMCERLSHGLSKLTKNELEEASCLEWHLQRRNLYF